MPLVSSLKIEFLLEKYTLPDLSAAMPPGETDALTPATGVAGGTPPAIVEMI
jgi:hypothetical protein